MEHVNLVSTNHPALTRGGACGFHRPNPSRNLGGQQTNIQDTLEGQGGDRAGLSTGVVEGGEPSSGREHLSILWAVTPPHPTPVWLNVS